MSQKHRRKEKVEAARKERAAQKAKTLEALSDKVVCELCHKEINIALTDKHFAPDTIGKEGGCCEDGKGLTVAEYQETHPQAAVRSPRLLEMLRRQKEDQVVRGKLQAFQRPLASPKGANPDSPLKRLDRMDGFFQRWVPETQDGIAQLWLFMRSLLEGLHEKGAFTKEEFTAAREKLVKAAQAQIAERKAAQAQIAEEGAKKAVEETPAGDTPAATPPIEAAPVEAATSPEAPVVPATPEVAPSAPPEAVPDPLAALTAENVATSPPIMGGPAPGLMFGCATVPPPPPHRGEEAICEAWEAATAAEEGPNSPAAFEEVLKPKANAITDCQEHGSTEAILGEDGHARCLKCMAAGLAAQAAPKETEETHV